MKRCGVVLMIVALLSSSVFGALLDGDYFKFTKGGLDVNAMDEFQVPVGGTVTVSLWAQVPSQNVTSFKALVAWDTAAATKDGNLAVDLPGAFINEQPGFNTLVTVAVNRNGQSATGAMGYGTYYAASMPSGAYADFNVWTKLETLTIRNVNLGPGQSHVVRLFNKAGAATGYDSAVIDSAGNSYSPIAGSEPRFTIAGVPEPISMLLLAIGGLFISRRK